MSQGETLIVILLIVIAYFLYQITKQLSFLSGRRFKIGFPKFTMINPLPRKKPVEEKFKN